MRRTSRVLVAIILVILSASASVSADAFFCSRALVLDGSIGEIFTIDGISGEAREVQFFVNGAGGTDEAINAVGTKIADGKYQYVCYVNSIMMANAIEATYRESKEHTARVETSVWDYLEFAKDHTSNPKMKDLAIKMAAYGYYAQQFLAEVNGIPIGTDAEDYAPIELLGDELSSQDVNDAKSALAGFRKTVVPGQSGNIESMKQSLLLDSSTVLRVYIEAASEPVVTVDGAPVAVCQKDNKWYVDVDNIPSHRLGVTHVITADDWTMTTSGISSCMDWIEYSDSENGAKLGAAFWQYYVAAMNYAGKNIPGGLAHA